MRILCTADVHIGRSSSADGEIVGEVSALAAWERIVEAAIQGKAAAIVIAGDLFDGLAAQYATRPRVAFAFERLRDHGILALAVAGNHDHSALPNFARSHPELIHVFPAERWGERRIGSVRIVGRSFSREFERESLLRDFDLGASDALTIGLVHADVDALSSYCPTPIRDFYGRGVAAWIVGHVHLPRVFDGDTPVAYPGSPQALDWGETGPHGFRWLSIENDRATFSDIIHVSTARYNFETIELGPDDFLEDKITSLSQRCREEQPGLESVQFRVHVRLCRGANAECPLGAVAIGADGYTVCSKVSIPDIDLALEAGQLDARGQAARLLLGLRGEGESKWLRDSQTLVSQVEASMKEERRRLNLPQEEDTASLRFGELQEARSAVQRALEQVLMPVDGVAP